MCQVLFFLLGRSITFFFFFSTESLELHFHEWKRQYAVCNWKYLYSICVMREDIEAAEELAGVSAVVCGCNTREI